MAGAARSRAATQQQQRPQARAQPQEESDTDAAAAASPSLLAKRRALVFKCAALVAAAVVASLLGVISQQFAMAITVVMYATVRFGAAR